MLRNVSLRGTVFALTISLSIAAHCLADTPRLVDIPAGELSQALLLLSKHYGADLVYRPEQVRGLRTNGAHGELTTEQAVIQLLEGTSLKLSIDATGAMFIAAPVPAETAVRLEEVVVTGSHIRGAQPAGTRLIVIDREAIDNSGYARVEDLLATLTENFKGVNEDINSSQSGAANSNRGAEVQLRGLGFGTTLTLVNGHRQAAGGLSGAFIDVSSIPTAAIERIEVLTDGASAIYGSDAIGGVVNIILRKNFEGAESRIRLGTAGGEADDLQLAQIAGTSWDRGGVVAGYQFSKRDALPSGAREYSAANGDLRRFGGDDLRQTFDQYYGNPGTILDSTGAPAYAIPTGQDGTNLSAAELIAGGINYSDNVTYSQLLPEQEMHSLFFMTSQELSDTWELTTEGRFGTRDVHSLLGGASATVVSVPNNNPFYVNPFGGTDPVRIAYDFARDLGPQTSSSTTDTYSGALGLTHEFSSDWQLRGSTSYGRERVRFRSLNAIDSDALELALQDSDPATALNVFGDGSRNNPETLDTLRVNELETTQSTVWSGGVIADGPVFSLPGGVARLAVGADYRNESLRSSDDGEDESRASRHTSAAFAELALPLLGGMSTWPGVHRLDLSLALRYEDYSDFGTTLDPKIGLSYQPWTALKLRGTWGTSFRAPPFFQSNEAFGSTAAAARRLRDPTSPSGTSNTLILIGNNPELKEETATVWTAGAEFAPPVIPEMTLSLTYFNYDYDGRIQTPGPQSSMLADEAIWGADVIIRNPSQARIDELCRSPDFVGGSCANVVAIIDRRWRNLAVVKVEGIDASLSHSIDSSLGRWSYGFGGTYMAHHRRAVTVSAPVVDILDTTGNPLSLRLRGSLSWSRNNFTANALVSYSGSYENATVTPATPVDSYTTVDLNFSYRMPAGHGWLSDMRVALSAVNVFDEIPPFVNEFDGYDGANSSILGRLLSVQVVKAW